MSDTRNPRAHTGYLVRRAQQRHVSLWSRMVSADTSSVQFSILVALDRRPESSQRELCEEVDLDRSTIADLLSRMERRGLLSRSRAAEDGRRNVVTLTPDGATELERLRPLVDRADAELTVALAPEELEALQHGLRQILTHPTNTEHDDAED
ncbi:MAG: MarR family winged helix-turn-helix transcriptional regulator [Microbacterium sp.]